jgi:hypothetical protein
MVEDRNILKMNSNLLTPSNASTKFNRNILNSIESDSI